MRGGRTRRRRGRASRCHRRRRRSAAASPRVDGRHAQRVARSARVDGRGAREQVVVAVVGVDEPAGRRRCCGRASPCRAIEPLPALPRCKVVVRAVRSAFAPGVAARADWVSKSRTIESCERQRGVVVGRWRRSMRRCPAVGRDDRRAVDVERAVVDRQRPCGDGPCMTISASSTVIVPVAGTAIAFWRGGDRHVAGRERWGGRRRPSSGRSGR